MARRRAQRPADGITMPAGRRIPRSPTPARPAAEPASGPPEIPGDVSSAGAELAALVRAVRSCGACSRASDHRVFGSGYPRAGVLAVKGRPSDEDLRSETALAAEAEALQRAFARLGIPFHQLYTTTAVRCAARVVTGPELRACSGHLLFELEAVGPRLILAFGPQAVEALRCLDGRCGLVVPEQVPRSQPVELRRGLQLLVTEPLPEGVRDQASKRALWRDLQMIPGLLGR